MLILANISWNDDTTSRKNNFTKLPVLNTTAGHQCWLHPEWLLECATLSHMHWFSHFTTDETLRKIQWKNIDGLSGALQLTWLFDEWIWVILLVPTRCQLSKLIMQDMPFKHNSPGWLIPKGQITTRVKNPHPNGRNPGSHTVYPKKYAHGSCFAVLCCGYVLTDLPISTRLTSLALWQSNDCPSASKATLVNMSKCIMWIHYEWLHNHIKAKHNKTVCKFLGIYCKWPDLKLLGWCTCSRTCTILLRNYIELWRHDLEILSTLLYLCEGKPPVTVGFPHQNDQRCLFGCPDLNL